MPSRPSYGAYKLDLLQQAVRQADIGPVTLLTEPEAAALDYARQERVPSGTVIAVYDFGGGTFDATILRKTDDGFEPLGQPEGLERLGGIDFDEALFRRAMEHVASQGVTVDAERPGHDGRDRPAARRVPACEGGALVRHRRDDRDLPAGLPDARCASPAPSSRT